MVNHERGSRKGHKWWNIVYLRRNRRRPIRTVLAHKTTKKRSNIYKNMALNQLIFNEFEKLAA